MRREPLARVIKTAKRFAILFTSRVQDHRSKAFFVAVAAALLFLYQNCSPPEVLSDQLANANARRSTSSTGSAADLSSETSMDTNAGDNSTYTPSSNSTAAPPPTGSSTLPPPPPPPPPPVTTSPMFGYKVAMVGDSITWGCGSNGDLWWKYLGLAPSEVISKAVPGQTTQDFLTKIDSGSTTRIESVIAARPKLIIILIGVNDLNYRRSLDEAARDYRTILSTFKARLPNTKVYVQSVLPVNEQQILAIPDHPLQTKNTEIIQLNERIRGLAAEFQYPFIEPRTLFVMPTGFMRPELTSDGLHLTGEGYERWGSYLRRTVTELGTQLMNGCAVQVPTCEGTDSVRRDSCGREVDRWAFAPGCETLACEGNDFVRRSGQGTELARWVNAPPPYCQ